MTDLVGKQTRQVAHTYLDMLAAMPSSSRDRGEADLEAVSRAADRLNIVGIGAVLPADADGTLMGTLDGDSLVTGAMSVIYILMQRVMAASPGQDELEVIAWVREQLDTA